MIYYPFWDFSFHNCIMLESSKISGWNMMWRNVYLKMEMHPWNISLNIFIYISSLRYLHSLWSQASSSNSQCWLSKKDESYIYFLGWLGWFKGKSRKHKLLWRIVGKVMTSLLSFFQRYFSKWKGADFTIQYSVGAHLR